VNVYFLRLAIASIAFKNISGDILKTHVPSWVFSEIKAAPAAEVYVTDAKTGAVLKFQRAITQATEKQNRFGWPVRRWRGQPTA